MFLENKNIILLSTGSFNPPTNMHLRIFEIARDHLTRLGYTVSGGLISPVHDSYKKKDLAPSLHRCIMIEKALAALPWVEMSDWEVKQKAWTRTLMVLKYHQNHINLIINSRIKYTHKEANSLLSLKFIENICANDSNKNKILNVRLLCGADLLESFAVPGLWLEEDIETIVRDYGLVVVSRSGSNPHKFIYESDILTKYMANIIVVTEWITNEISSTKVRRAVCRNESIKFLVSESVESYIKNHGLYGSLNDSESLPPSSLNDKKISIDEPNDSQHVKKRTKSFIKPKVRNVTDNYENCNRVAIQLSESGIIEVISDKETMV